MINTEDILTFLVDDVMSVFKKDDKFAILINKLDKIIEIQKRQIYDNNLWSKEIFDCVIDIKNIKNKNSEIKDNHALCKDFEEIKCEHCKK